jgi:hypothetical protein
MRLGGRAEPLGEAQLRIGVDVLPAQKDHAMAQQRPAELADNLLRELPIGHDTSDLGTDVAADLANFDVLVVTGVRVITHQSPQSMGRVWLRPTYFFFLVVVTGHFPVTESENALVT